MILDEEFFNNSEYFLGDVISSEMTSANYFQNGARNIFTIQLKFAKEIFDCLYRWG